jgi:hypothetical protein
MDTPPDDDGTPDREVSPVSAEARFDLQSQFACGRQHERPQTFALPAVKQIEHRE